jgi:hypothetical protein
MAGRPLRVRQAVLLIHFGVSDARDDPAAPPQTPTPITQRSHTYSYLLPQPRRVQQLGWSSVRGVMLVPPPTPALARTFYRQEKLWMMPGSAIPAPLLSLRR